MPITVAHPALVLPLARLTARWGVPLTPLVVGTMVPDVPLFAGEHAAYALTHAPLGIAVWAPLATTAVVLVWFAVVRDALVGLAPAAVRRRLAPHVSLPLRAWAWVPVAGVVGALTHVAWDSFTHPGRWGWETIPWLSAQQGPLPGGKWLQYGSGVVGMVLVAGAAVLWLRSRPTRDVPPRVTGVPLLELAVGAASVVALVSAVDRVPQGLHAVAFDGVVHGLVALVAALLLAAAAWHLLRLTRA